MDFSTLFKVGDTNINEYIVKQEHTADSLGNIGVIVLSTPSMIYFMEAAAARIITGKLPENYRPVGTKINVAAFNEKCKIGFGKYEQHIINLDKFINRP